MDNLISKEYLKKSEVLYEERILINLNKILDNVVNIQGKLNNGVFLSHKHTDKKLVYELIKLFNDFQVDTYIDWLDEDMPAVTNQDTAIKIKQKINSSKKFLLLATEDAINSKWCNWELGLGDAVKYHEHIAIIPVTETNNGNWNGNEYLQIYPCLKIDKDKRELFVEFNGKKENFKDWLNN